MVVVASEAEEEAWRFPDMWSEPATVEEALEINPERFAKPPTLKVEEADNGPLTLSWALTVEEAEEIKPDRFAKPLTLKVPTIVEEPWVMKPPL